jgi:hypothetical protein
MFLHIWQTNNRFHSSIKWLHLGKVLLKCSLDKVNKDAKLNMEEKDRDITPASQFLGLLPAHDLAFL